MSFGSLDGGGVSDGGMNVCVCDVVYDDVSDAVGLLCVMLWMMV